MSAEGYADFLKKLGHRVVRSGDLWWFDVHPHVYTSFPFQSLADPRRIDLRDVMGKDGWIARFPCPSGMGRPSYRIVVDDPRYDLKSLAGKARNQTRRGLERCEVRAVPSEFLSEAGLRLHEETLKRQGRVPQKSFRSSWLRYTRAASDCRVAEAWAAFYEDQMASFLIAFRMDEVAHILIMRSSTPFLRHYPNNALLFQYVRHTLSAGGMREVSIGFESIQEGMDSLDHFKVGMGFSKRAMDQRIELRPSLARVLRKPLLRLGVRVLGSRWAGEQGAKLAGLFRWYSEQGSGRAWSG